MYVLYRMCVTCCQDKTSSAKIIFDSSDEEDLRVSATAKETSVSGNAGTTRDSSDESSSSDDDTHKQVRYQ